MLNNSATDDEDEEVKPAPAGKLTPRQVRILKIAIGVMSILLAVGFVLLIVGIYYQTSKKKTPDTAHLLQQRLGAPLPLLNVPLRPGTQIINVLADQGRLIVHMRETAGDEVVVVDLTTGWLQQRISFRPQP